MSEKGIELLGTVWTHRKKGGLYRLTQCRSTNWSDEVYLTAESEGRRSTWKAECLLEFDYEQVKP